MKKGFKERAVNVFFNALSKLRCEVVNFKVLDTIIDNVRPLVNMKAFKVAAIKYYLPTPLNSFQSKSKGVRKIINFANNRRDFGFLNRLFFEMLETFQNSSASVFNKEDTYFLSIDNRPFMNYIKRKNTKKSSFFKYKSKLKRKLYL